MTEERRDAGAYRARTLRPVRAAAVAAIVAMGAGVGCGQTMIRRPPPGAPSGPPKGAVSLALAWRALRFSSLRERAGGAAAAWAAALLTILPMYDFGQREHLALVAMLPALAVYVLRANRETVAPSAPGRVTRATGRRDSPLA